MNKIEKWVTMIVALIGATTGVWAAYNNHALSEFSKPINLREATVKSFLSQIESATHRDDKEEVLRVRVEYEKYEETWRKGRELASITVPIANLVSFKLTPEQNYQLEGLLENADAYIATGVAEPVAVASAYLATGDYVNANRYFEHAAIKEPSSTNLLALRSLALAGKAEQTQDQNEYIKILEQSVKYAKEAEKEGVDISKLGVLRDEIKANKRVN